MMIMGLKETKEYQRTKKYMHKYRPLDTLTKAKNDVQQKSKYKNKKAKWIFSARNKDEKNHR